ncbi:HMA2 domain-containing protein [Peribacillus sp. NPDC096540]|uniref:HMA2 domain-containing protein n=1 Tax=Peribacillus sp. NPDC096540 TaxID=3390612 RepID=UPI003D064697
MISTIMGIGASLFAPKIMSQFRDQKIKVIHAMPGRLRIQCDNWKNPIVANILNDKVEKHPLISTATASPITGSFTLEFIVPHISQQELDDVLHSIVQIASDAMLYADATLMRGMKKTMDTVDVGIKRQTNGFADFDSLFVLFLLGKGIHGFSSGPTFSASLFFWAYSIVKGKGSDRPHV